MGKKKKNKNKSISILNEVDKVIDTSYESLREEIKEMQLKLYMADQEAMKKAKKAAKRSGKRNSKEFYDANKVRREVRKEVIKTMEKDSCSFIDRAMKFLQDLSPVLVAMSRLIASLINCILSLDIVKVWIKPETLEKIDKLYKRAMSFC